MIIFGLGKQVRRKAVLRRKILEDLEMPEITNPGKYFAKTMGLVRWKFDPTWEIYAKDKSIDNEHSDGEEIQNDDEADMDKENEEKNDEFADEDDDDHCQNEEEVEGDYDDNNEDEDDDQENDDPENIRKKKLTYLTFTMDDYNNYEEDDSWMELVRSLIANRKVFSSINVCKKSGYPSWNITQTQPPDEWDLNLLDYDVWKFLNKKYSLKLKMRVIKNLINNE